MERDSLFAKIQAGARQPVDNTFLVYFRIAFGVILFWGTVKYFRNDAVFTHYIAPSIHFGYYGFEWVKPWPGNGMYYHMLVVAVSAACIALGFGYGLFASVFFYAFTFVFLLDQSFYLNHYYLICLLAMLMIYLPANRSFALDVYRNPEIRTDTCPAWVLWLLRLQVAIPYVYGGIAKLNYDWIVRHEPLKTWMADKTDMPLIGERFTDPNFVALFSWSGLLIDLFCVPLLFWRFTRIPMLIVVTMFHLLNDRLFNIGIFPWLMMAATILLFLPPDLIGKLRFWGRQSESDSSAPEAVAPLSVASKYILYAFMGIQLLIPFRHHLYPGNVALTREGHCFSWRMKLNIRAFDFQLSVHYEDGRTEPVRLIDWLTQAQAVRMRNLDQVVKLARHIRKEKESKTDQRVEVRGSGTVGLNGRPPVRLFENVDLSRERITLLPAKWLLTNPANPANASRSED